MSALILERHSVRLLGLSVSPASYLNLGYEYKEQNPKYLESSSVSISKLHLDEEIQGS